MLLINNYIPIYLLAIKENEINLNIQVYNLIFCTENLVYIVLNCIFDLLICYFKMYFKHIKQICMILSILVY